MATEEMLEEAFKKSMEENSKSLQEVMMSDFMMHLGTMSLVLLTKHLMEGAKTPELKEAYKSIPDLILSTWEQSRKGVLSDAETYINMFSASEKAAFLLSKEELEKCAKRLAEEEKQRFDAIMVTLHKVIEKVKGLLNTEEML